MWIFILIWLIFVYFALTYGGGVEVPSLKFANLRGERVKDADEKAVINYFAKTVPECFGPPNEKQLQKLFPALKIEQILGIRKLWAVQQIINMGTPKIGPGMDILAAVKKYKVPPLTIMKFMPVSKAGPLLEKLKKMDIYTYPDEQDAARRAAEYEEKLGKLIKIPYYTQDEIQDYQKEKYGRAIATPDFLFKKPTASGTMWIDAKNFYAANIRFMKKKILEQAQKYVKMFGPGIMVFSKGYNETYSLPGTKFMGIEEFKNKKKTF
jgi:hypothetical protein